MHSWLHEVILCSALAIIMGTCIYLNPPAGLLVASAGIYWIARVLKRDED